MSRKLDKAYDILDRALDYIARGWQTRCRLPYRQKGPTLDGWQTLRITRETAPQYFNGEQQNVGVILLGKIDIDLDCAYARWMADRFLPLTHARFGRASEPDGHRLYALAGEDRGTEFPSPIRPLRRRNA